MPELDRDLNTQRRPLWRSPRSLLYLVALIFLGIVLWRSKFWDSNDALRNVEWPYFVLVPLLSLALAVPLALRGRAILSALGYRAAALAVAPLAYYGNTVGFMTPAASGEVLRPALLRRTFGVPNGQGVGVVLFERLFSFYLLGLSCLLALSWTDTVPSWVGLVAAPLLIAAVLAPSAFVAVAPAMNSHLPIRRLRNLLPERLRERISGPVKESSSTLGKLWLNASVIASFVALSAGTFLLMAVQFWLIPEALGEGLSLQEAWVIVTVSSMAGFLSGLPLGLGATDAVMLSLLRAYGVDTTTAGQIVILNRVLINLPTGLLGLCSYLLAVRQRSTPAPTQPVAQFTTASAGGNQE